LLGCRVVADELPKRIHAWFYTQNNRGEAAREAVYKDQCRRANNEDESHAVIHLAVRINEYSPCMAVDSESDRQHPIN
jgi:hypothetical protein